LMSMGSGSSKKATCSRRIKLVNAHERPLQPFFVPFRPPGHGIVQSILSLPSTCQCFLETPSQTYPKCALPIF
jgi:hypothetical protein